MGGRRARDDEVAAWRDDGWVVIEGLVDTDEIDEARADLHLLFATPERYHANPDEVRPARAIGRGAPGAAIPSCPSPGPRSGPNSTAGGGSSRSRGVVR